MRISDWSSDVCSSDLSLRFNRHDNGPYLPAYSDMKINFGLQGSDGGAFGQRTLVYSGYDTETIISPATFSGQQTTKIAGADARSAAYWNSKRPVTLTTVEAKTYANLDSLQNKIG